MTSILPQPPSEPEKPVYSTERPVRRLTLPKSIVDALGGKGAPKRLWALLRDVLTLVLIDVPWIAANRHVIVQRVLEPHTLVYGDCDCDEQSDVSRETFQEEA